MAKNAEKFEAKCDCGAVRVGKVWRNSFLIRGIPEVEGLPIEKCSNCKEEKILRGVLHKNRMLLSLD